MLLEKLALYGLRMLDPEQAHGITLSVLEKYSKHLASNHRPIKTLDGKVQTLMGLKFVNRVGIAAGLDKDGACINGLVGMGAGCIELGGVTPLPQSGNEGKRILRLSQQQAMINRLGFNNLGCQQLAQRIKEFRSAYKERHGEDTRSIIGVNIGKNAKTPLEDAGEDYKKVLRAIYLQADYATINISSPNTKGLRDLQTSQYLPKLLESTINERDKLQKTHNKHMPLLVKLSPDADEAQLKESVRIINDSGIAGIIATNTSVEHPWNKLMEGGLSGRPLAVRAMQTLQLVKSELKDGICLIACGGIDSKEEMQRRLDAGADLVQLYTALVYQGAGLVASMCEVK